MHRIWYHWYICWNGEPGSRLYLFIYIIHIAAYSRWTLTFGSRKLVYLRIYAQNLLPLVLWYIHWNVELGSRLYLFIYIIRIAAYSRWIGLQKACILRYICTDICLQKACIFAYICTESGTTGIYPGMWSRVPHFTRAYALYE